MDAVIDFINSGVLELYVLGQATEQDALEVERMSEAYPQIREEVNSIAIALESYAEAHAVEPDPMIEPMLMATIDYMERLKNGEQPSFPPLLHAGSRISDYSEWLNREDLQLMQPLDKVQARIIGYTPQATTVIAWLQYGAPPETHTGELEQFLIVEGTCDITIENEVHHMQPGGVLIIPLHKTHHVTVTSSIPCKVILQRVAA
jgi:mannose-6-phosphate isomerase-like protein (cupin superfamily)